MRACRKAESFWPLARGQQTADFDSGSSTNVDAQK
jgi:hypothetical protein